MEPTKKEREEALAEWRARHWAEMDKSLEVLVTIRDSALLPKDRIEAVKGITRMLGGTSTRPADAAKPAGSNSPTVGQSAMNAEEAAEVESILSLRRYADRLPT